MYTYALIVKIVIVTFLVSLNDKLFHIMNDLRNLLIFLKQSFFMFHLNDTRQKFQSMQILDLSGNINLIQLSTRHNL